VVDPPVIAPLSPPGRQKKNKNSIQESLARASRRHPLSHHPTAVKKSGKMMKKALKKPWLA